MRFIPEQIVFGVHFTFNTLVGQELYTQPLLANNKQPERIEFNKFSTPAPIHFGPKPKEGLEAYALTDQNGYVFYNQYPAPRRDVPVVEGDNRFNLGVEYPWYQSIVAELPSRMQYEYHELTHFLNKCTRGITEITAKAKVETDPVAKQRAFDKGKAVEQLYIRTVNEFRLSYPEYEIVTTHYPGENKYVARIELKEVPVADE